MPSDNWTIQFVSSMGCRKICRIWFGGDGSYYVTAPYHRARSASVHVSTAYYERRRSTVRADANIEVGLLDDDDKRLKLSHHPDGFAQFSGEGIISGRDETGRPKGIGIMSFALDRPPRTGPSFACAVLGMDHFAAGDSERSNAINFYDAEIPPLKAGRGLILEGSYFTADWRGYLYRSDEHWFIDMRHNMGPIIRYRALLSSTVSGCFIGLRIFRADVVMDSHTSGFILSGPSSNVRTVEGERVADGIYCLYPSMDHAISNVRSLQYLPDQPPETPTELDGED